MNMKPARENLLVLALFLLAFAPGRLAAGQSAIPTPTWVGTWAASQQLPEPQNSLAPAALQDVTIRQIVRLSGLGLNSPIRAVRALRKAGWLRVTRSGPNEERRGASNRYSPNLAKLAA